MFFCKRNFKRKQKQRIYLKTFFTFDFFEKNPIITFVLFSQIVL